MLLPETTNTRVALESSSMVMPVDVAVNPVTVVGDEGTSRAIPEAGTGEGMETSKLNGDGEMFDGVAPKASSSVVADPEISVFPRAAAASASA
jgi:hypothetical protein